MSVLRSFKVLEGWILVECTVEAHVWRYSGIASLLKRQVDGQTRCLAAEAPTEPEFAKARTTSLDSFKLVRLLLVRGSSPSLGMCGTVIVRQREIGWRRRERAARQRQPHQ